VAARLQVHVCGLSLQPIGCMPNLSVTQSAAVAAVRGLWLCKCWAFTFFTCSNFTEILTKTMMLTIFITVKTDETRSGFQNVSYSQMDIIISDSFFMTLRHGQAHRHLFHGQKKLLTICRVSVQSGLTSASRRHDANLLLINVFLHQQLFLPQHVQLQLDSSILKHLWQHNSEN